MATHDTDQTNDVHLPRRLDPEDAQLALTRVQEQLRRHAVVEHLVHKQEEGQQSAPIVENLLQRQHETELRGLVNSLHPADIAFILESLPKDDRQMIWQLVRAEFDADVLIEVADWVRQSLIETMDRADLVAATENMDADEIADLIANLPPDVVAEVQKGLTPKERAQLIEAMGYPEDSVGGIMDFDMLRVRDDVTLKVVLRYLRRLDELPDHTDQIFVVDRTDQLLGTLPLSALLLNRPSENVRDVMSTDYLSLDPMDEDAEAAQAFERYDLVSAPVVDRRGRLIGRVSIADVVDVIREDSEEQELSRAGMQEEDIFEPVSRAIRNRAPWLLLNLCTAGIAAFVASRFEDTVSHIVVLAFLMSIVAGLGGNSGNQTMTLIIRALAVGRVTAQNAWQLIKRELAVTMLVASIGSFVAGGFAWWISDSIPVALVMMAAMIGNMLVGAMVGVLVPMIRSRLGKDPAMGSSVLLTFATDSLGFLIFLGLATIFLM
ncbi:MAG TPA: magnesium transporter [Orrella sp.]